MKVSDKKSPTPKTGKLMRLLTPKPDHFNQFCMNMDKLQEKTDLT